MRHDRSMLRVTVGFSVGDVQKNSAYVPYLVTYGLQKLDEEKK